MTKDEEKLTKEDSEMLYRIYMITDRANNLTPSFYEQFLERIKGAWSSHSELGQEYETKLRNTSFDELKELVDASIPVYRLVDALADQLSPEASKAVNTAKDNIESVLLFIENQPPHIRSVLEEMLEDYIEEAKQRGYRR